MATVFANNGSGVRGDMKAVIAAILTDAEARDDAGALASSIRQSARAGGAAGAMGQGSWRHLADEPVALWQYQFFRQPAGRGWAMPQRVQLVSAGLCSAGHHAGGQWTGRAGFQITNEPSVVAYVNFMAAVITNGAGEANRTIRR